MKSLLLFISLLFTYISTPNADSPELNTDLGRIFKGRASYYGVKLNGHRTASGEIMDKSLFTCAHKTLPFGTMLEVKNLKNQKKVIVRVNDRGPYSNSRILDISFAAAQEIEMITSGTADIEAIVIGKNGVVAIKPVDPLLDILNLK